MIYPTTTNDQDSGLRREIEGLRDHIDHQRRRIDLMLEYALVASMTLTVVMILVVGLT